MTWYNNMADTPRIYCYNGFYIVLDMGGRSTCK